MGSIKAPQNREYPVCGVVKTDAKARISKVVALHRTRRTPFGAEHMTIQRPTITPSSDLERTCRRLSVRPGCWTWSTCRQSDGARQLRPRPMEVWAWGEASESYTRERQHAARSFFTTIVLMHVSSGWVNPHLLHRRE